MGIMNLLYTAIVVATTLVIVCAILYFATHEGRHKVSDIIKTWGVPAVCLIVALCSAFSLVSEVKSKQGTFELDNSRVTVYSDNDMFTYTVDKNTGLVRSVGKTVPEFTQILTEKGFTERKE